jgi:hypothetical protein
LEIFARDRAAPSYANDLPLFTSQIVWPEPCLSHRSNDPCRLFRFRTPDGGFSGSISTRFSREPAYRFA